MLTKTKQLKSPNELKKQIPLQVRQEEFIKQQRLATCNILDGSDSRMLLVIGPCSIHDVKAAQEYAMNLKELATEVEDEFLILMRVYFEKPRTALGWKGILHDPHLDRSNDITHGIEITRQLLVEMAHLEVAVAAELLDPFSINYFSDLISWGCIGARTTSSQTHRQLASGLSIPIGFKNSTDGNIHHAVNGVLSAAVPHTYLGIDDNGRAAAHTTTGNPLGHVVLRGGKDQPNYDAQSVSRALKLLREANLPERMIIDCSHDNCMGLYEHQRVVFQSVINQRCEGNSAIRGLILESHLKSGHQKLDETPLKHGVSITDPCIDWDTTAQLVRWGREKLNPLIVNETLCAVD